MSSKNNDAKTFKYECDECIGEHKYRTNDRSNFDKHMRTHTKDRPYVCLVREELGKDIAFAQSSQLTSHVLQAHEKAKKYYCQICIEEERENKYSAFNQKDLDKHILTVHKGEKPFKCEQCENSKLERSFSQIGHLNEHIKHFHEGKEKTKKQFECDRCKEGGKERFFTTKGDLNVHIQSFHEGVRHHCENCDRSYSQKRDLNKHLKSCPKN